MPHNNSLQSTRVFFFSVLVGTRAEKGWEPMDLMLTNIKCYQSKGFIQIDSFPLRILCLVKIKTYISSLLDMMGHAWLKLILNQY